MSVRLGRPRWSPSREPHVGSVRPVAGAHRALDRQGSGERGVRRLEHGEVLVAARVDLAAACAAHTVAEQPPDIREQLRVARFEAPDELPSTPRRRRAGTSRDPSATRRLDLLPGPDEADRHHTVPLRSPEQTRTRAIARVLVLERDLPEPRERVPDM